MYWRATTALALLIPYGALAQTQQGLHASYNTYAAGMHVAEVRAGLDLGKTTYQMSLVYRTTGVVGLFFDGHQADRASGSWDGVRATPSQYVGEGFWRGADRRVEIEYRDGRPMIRALIPPVTGEREPVPEAIQANTVDTLSAVAELIRAVDETGRCEAKARMFDGRRAFDIEAHTVGEETLEATGRSKFSGKALRCDFTGRMRAGFLLSEDRDRSSRPMRGSAWIARVMPGRPSVPVRLAFETKWFGDATMYLTDIGTGSTVQTSWQD